jgi:hypothetical protein
MSADALPLAFNEKSHRYTLDGQWVPSVTAIVDGGLPKPALKRWGERVVAESAVDQLETLGRILATMGRNPTIDALAATPYEQMKTAQVRGTAVHKLAENVAHGLPVDVPEELADYVRGYISFLEKFDVEPLAVEGRIANRTWWYAGTFDLLANIHGRVWLLDLKTSRNVYGETALQCAAYSRAELCIAQGALVDFPPVDNIGVLHVTDQGTNLYDLGDIDAATDEFLACLVTYNGTRRRNKTLSFDAPLRPENV